jgi:hypothetical protein
MKGQWKTMEAIIAGVVMLLFLAALNAGSSQVASQGPPSGGRVLQSLDDMGLLRGAACGGPSAVDQLVSSTRYLAGYNHTVQICDEADTCSGQRPSKENVWSYSHLLSGGCCYEPLEVVLYVFRE